MRQSPSTTPGVFRLGVFRWQARHLRTNVACCRALCHFLSLPVACAGRRRGLQSQLRSPMTLNEMHPISQALLIAGAATILALPALGDPRAKHQQARPVATTRIVQTYGKLPLSFEANRGQTNQNVKFLSRGRGHTLFLTCDGSGLSLKHGADSGVVRTRLLGTGPPCCHDENCADIRKTASELRSEQGADEPEREVPLAGERVYALPDLRRVSALVEARR